MYLYLLLLIEKNVGLLGKGMKRLFGKRGLMLFIGYILKVQDANGKQRQMNVSQSQYFLLIVHASHQWMIFLIHLIRHLLMIKY